MEIIELILVAFNIFIFMFAGTVMLSYCILAAISAFSLRSYLHKNEHVTYQAILSLPDAPYVSLIAPAYNEGVSIVDNVRSLLSINYNNYDVIVINDGSTDDSLQKLKQNFDLVKVKFEMEGSIPTNKLRGIYRSKNPAFSKLIVADKVNGGKADALNLGVNISKNPYVVCVDVDCIMDKDVILKLAKPFLAESNRRLLATGGVVRIANSCVIKSGKLVKVTAPDNMLARIQVLEYLRAFILGRMAWAKLDGLLIISGAFGMFDKEIVRACGGYDTKTVGEDMELVVRMRRYMIENKKPYMVQYIPDPLCWTEAPESYSVLKKQRSRWTRGTLETLWIHKKVFLNPKYKVLGLISYPYWFLYEYLAPLFEFFGVIVTIVSVIFGIVNFKIFALLYLLVYLFAVMFSMIALYAEEMTFARYHSYSDLWKLVIAALLEPIIFHPFTVYCAIKGNIDKIRGSKGWGEMSRTGFSKK